VQQVEPERFRQAFGATVGELDTLVDAKTVTISRLMEIAPSGTIDPSSTVYNSTMFAMAGLLVIALLANLLIRTVDPKHYLKED